MQILSLKKEFSNPYECKIFIVGITQVLTIMDAPEMVRRAQTISRLLQEILMMLDKVKKKEAKNALKKGSKAIQRDDPEDSEDDDSYTDSEEDSNDDEWNQGQQDQNSASIKETKGGKRSRSNSDNNMVMDEEVKTSSNVPTLDNMGLGFTEDEVDPKADEEEQEDSDDD